MDRPDRLKRPNPPRTAPKRGVLGALGQADPFLAEDAGMQNGMNGGHPLGPGFDEPVGNGVAASDPLHMIDQGVRAASDLVDEHIRQGEETAKALGINSAAIPLGQADLSGLLTGLVRAYSDAASAWVGIVGSLAQKIDGGKVAPAPPQPQAVTSSVGLSVISAGGVDVSIELFRPAAAFVTQPLASVGVSPPAQITDVRFDPGNPGSAGRICVRVPVGQPAGTYHGVLLSGEDQSPSGVLTLQVLGDTGPETPL